MKNKRISVVVVTYNAVHYIDECLENIIANKGDVDELVIIDGKSVDGTVEVINKWIKHIDFFESKEDSGIYDAMNKAVQKATGDFILFMGADDRLLIKLNLVRNSLVADNLIYHGDVILSGSDQRYGGIFSKSRLVTENIPHQACFYPREVFQSYKYNLKYKLLADYDLNFKLMSDRRFKFKFVNFVVSRYSTEGLSSTGLDKEFRKNLLCIIFRNLGLRFVFLFISRLTTKKFNVK